MKIMLSIKTHNDDLLNSVSWRFYFCHYQVTPTSRTQLALKVTLRLTKYKQLTTPHHNTKIL